MSTRQKTDPTWLDFPEKYSDLNFESRKYILHPFLMNLAMKHYVNNFLEYGCGDSSHLLSLPKNIEISLYDISKKALLMASKNLSDLNPIIYNHSNDLPKDYFDCILFSLVLMTIGDTNEITKIFQLFASILKPTGHVYIAITHPCFRQYKFSTFHTEFTDGKPFEYLNDGKKFQVTMEDIGSKKRLSFYDYHWSLSKTINLLIESGLTIMSAHELADDAPKNNYYNSNYCPYMVIECKINAYNPYLS